MNKKTISLVLGIMCFLLTVGISIQVKTNNSIGTITSTNATENELRNEILKLREKYDNLYQDLENAEERLEKERTNASQNSTELTELEDEIKNLNKALGLTEVTGTGVIVTLDDNKKINANNYLGDPNDLIVHDIDIINIVNELKNAGAEAISINDQRIVSTTAIECDGNVIKVNRVKIGAPFEIKAIGYPELLLGGLNRYNGYLMILRENYGIDAPPAIKSDKITIPKYTGVIKFNYAVSK